MNKSLFAVGLLLWCILFADGTNNNNNDDEYGDYYDLFSDSEYNDILLNQRVRREIRDLSISEWQRIANAVNIMKC